MKRKEITLLLAGLLLYSFSPIKSQTMVGGKHDLTTHNISAWPGVCESCHMVSVGLRPLSDVVDGALLWDQSLIESPISIWYADNTAFDEQDSQRSGIAAMCISCHDGILFSEYQGSTLPASPDHGISRGGITYTTEVANANGNLYDPSIQTSTMGGTIDSDLLSDYCNFYNPPADCKNDQLDCSSCHTAHFNSYGNFLRVDNTTQGLCLICHKTVP